MDKNKPNFFVIGAPRSGTTSIYMHLKAHPDIFMPETTELRYFNREEMISTLRGSNIEERKKKICTTWEQYMSFFEKQKEESAIGECTTTYMYSEKALHEIKEKLGDKVKLIIVLREPVSRAFSNYMYYVRNGREKLSFGEVVNQEEQRVKEGWNRAWFHVKNSMYAGYIENIIKLGLSFKIVLYEDFRQDERIVLKTLYEFLGVDVKPQPENIDIVYNRGGVYKNKSLIQWMLQPSTFRRTLKKILPLGIIKNLRDTRDKFISKQTQPVMIDPDMAIKLKESFREDVERFAKIHPLDISKWNY